MQAFFCSSTFWVSFSNFRISFSAWPVGRPLFGLKAFTLAWKKLSKVSRLWRPRFFSAIARAAFKLTLSTNNCVSSAFLAFTTSKKSFSGTRIGCTCTLALPRVLREQPLTTDFRSSKPFHKSCRERLGT